MVELVVEWQKQIDPASWRGVLKGGTLRQE